MYGNGDLNHGSSNRLDTNVKLEQASIVTELVVGYVSTCHINIMMGDITVSVYILKLVS